MEVIVVADITERDSGADIINRLYEIDPILFDEHQLSSGALSPIYVDLKKIISFPCLLDDLAQDLVVMMLDLEMDVILGVPRAAERIAILVSNKTDIPMIAYREKAKEYGTRKKIEGVYQEGQVCLLIEDVVTTAASVLRAAYSLEREGLKVRDILSIVDREEGGRENIEKAGYNPHSMFKVTQLLDCYLQGGRIAQDQYDYIVRSRQ